MLVWLFEHLVTNIIPALTSSFSMRHRQPADRNCHTVVDDGPARADRPLAIRLRILARSYVTTAARSFIPFSKR